MNAPAFPALGAQYLRLFGPLSPEQVMPVPPLSASCDPSQVVEGPFYQWLAELGHPSARALADIAALRLRHLEKGHTPSADAAHGPMWFWHGVHEFWWRAMDAGDDYAARRKHLVAAAALLVACIDCNDFVQQEALNHDRA